MAEADGSRLDTDLGGDQSVGGYGHKGKHRGGGMHRADGVRIGSGKSSRPWASGSRPPQPPTPKRNDDDAPTGPPVGSPQYIEQWQEGRHSRR